MAGLQELRVLRLSRRVLAGRHRIVSCSSSGRGWRCGFCCRCCCCCWCCWCCWCRCRGPAKASKGTIDKRTLTVPVLAVPIGHLASAVVQIDNRWLGGARAGRGSRLPREAAVWAGVGHLALFRARNITICPRRLRVGRRKVWLTLRGGGGGGRSNASPISHGIRDSDGASIGQRFCDFP